MSNALEMSLDEIIGETEDTRRSNRASRGPRDSRGPRPSSYRYDKRDDRDRTSRARSPRRGDNFRDRDSGDREYKPRQTRVQRLSRGNPYIKISNLNYNITSDMLKELFDTIGPVAFVDIDYDHNNRPSGKAFVGFENFEAHNRLCVEEFDGKQAGGQIIEVEEIKPLTILGLTSNSRPSSNSSDRYSRRPRGDLYIPGGENNDRRRRDNRDKPPRRGRVNADDLDKELEEYMNRSNQTTESGSEPANVERSTEDKMEY